MTLGPIGPSGGPQHQDAADAPAPAIQQEAAVVRGAAAPSHAAATATSAPPFSSGMSTGVKSLNGHAWHGLALGTQVRAALGKIGGGAMPIEAGDWKLPVAALKGLPTDYSKHTFGARSPATSWTNLTPARQAGFSILHDAVMVGDADGRQYFGKFDPLNEDLSVQRLQPGGAFAAMLPRVLESNGVGAADLQGLTGAALAAAKQKQADVTAGFRTVLSSMLHDPNEHVFHVSWDNADDTDREALVAVNATTGEVRTLVSINPP